MWRVYVFIVRRRLQFAGLIMKCLKWFTFVAQTPNSMMFAVNIVILWFISQIINLFQIQTYFRCPREILAESIVEIMQVIRFQTMHAACLMKRFNVMVSSLSLLV